MGLCPDLIRPLLVDGRVGPRLSWFEHLRYQKKRKEKLSISLIDFGSSIILLIGTLALILVVSITTMILHIWILVLCNA